MTQPPVHRYRSDFHENREGEVLSLPGYGGSSEVPEPGDIVELFDMENNACLARVARVAENGLTYSDPIRGTWLEANEIEFPTLTDALREMMATSLAASLDAERKTSTQDEEAPDRKVSDSLREHA